jgi:hypothetical protein
MLDDSSTRAPCSVAYFTNLFAGIGRSDSSEGSGLCTAGSKNGRAPVGEAWLLEDMSRWSMPAIFKKVYSGCIRYEIIRISM